MDEAIFAFGKSIENELNGMKKGKTESADTFSRRKQTAFMRLIGADNQIKFASPIATK